MDSRITKKRLNDFLSYEWILIIAIAVAVIVAWEILFTVFSVKLKIGEDFKCLYDYQIEYSGSEKLSEDLYQDEVFSPFVIRWGMEGLTNDQEIVKARLGVQDADVMFTSMVETDGKRKVNDYIDHYLYPVYSYDELLKDAKDYLKGFTDAEGVDVTDYANLSPQKIEESFLLRYKKDNRFRTDEQKAEGISLEKGRLNRLCQEVKDFEKAIEIGKEKGIFYTYTRYEQLNRVEGGYDQWLEQEVKNQAFGLDMGKLTGGEQVPQVYAKLAGATDANGAVLIVFNFKQYQPDLQFECISFVNMIIRNCTDIL